MNQIQKKVPKHILEKLEKADINSIEEFLTKPKNELHTVLKAGEKEIEVLINVIREIVLKKSFTKVSVIEPCKYLKTGCTNIDDIIKGIPVNSGITEIYGESGSGKTQLALHLSLQVQQSEIAGGLNGGCVYICVENIFPSKRLHEMQSYFKKIQIINTKEHNYCDNIFIEHVADVDQFKHQLAKRIPILLLRENIKLIIVDSIAGIFRYDNETKNYISRSDDLLYISKKLNDFSNDYKLVVVCLNQVTADPLQGLKPCLGLAWSNLVQNRFQILRSGKLINLGNQKYHIRHMKVDFSSCLPVQIVNFIITKKGIENFI